MSDLLGSPHNISASGVVKGTGGGIIGFLCTSSSSGTVALYDNASAGSGNNILPTMSVAAGTYYPFPAKLGAGLYATIGGTANIVFILA